MSQWVMNKNRTILPIQTLRKLRDDELTRLSDIKLHDEFDQAIAKRYGTSINPPSEFLPPEVKLSYHKMRMEPLNQVLLKSMTYLTMISMSMQTFCYYMMGSIYSLQQLLGV